MQAIIDIIAARCHALYGYHDRGDPVSFDWQWPALTADNNWHDLNLSGIVPAGALLVLFSVFHRASATSARFLMRQNGNYNEFNVASLRSQNANILQDTHFLVSPDANGIVEYRIVPFGTDYLRLTVLGWFGPES